MSRSRVVLGDVEVRRVHQRADDVVDGGVELVEARRVAAQLRDAEQRGLQRLRLARSR